MLPHGNIRKFAWTFADHSNGIIIKVHHQLAGGSGILLSEPGLHQEQLAAKIASETSCCQNSASFIVIQLASLSDHAGGK